MSYPQGNYPTRNLVQPYPRQKGGYPPQPQYDDEQPTRNSAQSYPRQKGGYPPQPQYDDDQRGYGQQGGYFQQQQRTSTLPQAKRVQSRTDQSYDNSLNDSMQNQTQMPLRDGRNGRRQESSSSKSKKTEELKGRIAAIENYKCLNYCGICVAISAIISGLIFVIIAVAATSLFQTGCSSASALTSEINNAAATEEAALNNTSEAAATSQDLSTADAAAEAAINSADGDCNGAADTIKGVLIGIGVTIVVLESIIIFGHCIGLSAYKSYDTGKMNCAHTFYVIFLVIGVITCNICWCAIYYMLMTKSQQLRDMFRELQTLQSKR